MSCWICDAGAVVRAAHEREHAKLEERRCPPGAGRCGVDGAVGVEGDVEVHTHEHPAIVDVQIRQGEHWAET